MVPIKLKKDDYDVLVVSVVSLIIQTELLLAKEKSPLVRSTQKELLAKGRNLLDRMLAPAVKGYKAKTRVNAKKRKVTMELQPKKKRG